MYLDEAEVPASCTRFPIVEMQGSADGTSRSALIGAHAILLPEVREPSTGTRIAGALLGIGANRKGQSTAYRCADPVSDPAGA